MLPETDNAFVKNTAIYSSIPLLRNAINFLILPVYTRILTPEDFGIVGLLSMIASFVFGVLTIDFQSASQRFYFKYQDHQDFLRKMLSTNLLFLLFVSCLGIVGIYFSYPLLNSFYFKGKIGIIWLFAIFLQYIMITLGTMNQTILQNRFDGKNWMINELISIALNVPITLSLLLFTNLKFEAILIGALSAEGIKCIFTFYKLRNIYGAIFNFTFFKESFLYSWPNIPNVLIGTVMNVFDKSILSRYKGNYDVGLIDMTYRISYIPKMILDSINGAFSPVIMDNLEKRTIESHQKIAESNLKVVALIFFFMLGISYFTEELLTLLTTPDFYIVKYFVPLYIYYYVFPVVTLVPYWLIRFPGKTYYTIPLSILNIILFVGSNVIFVPLWGALGVAISMFIVGVISSLITIWVGLRAHYIDLKIIKLTVIMFITLIFTGILFLIYSFEFHFIIGIFLKTSFLFTYLLICIRLEIFTFKEIKYNISTIFNELFKKIKPIFTRK